MTSSHHLAQVNVGILRAPIDAPEIQDFVAALDPVNRMADAAPGFVWRLKAEQAGDTNHIDETLVVNLSVWETYEHLHEFVYRTAHAGFLRRRLEWFEKMDVPITTLWWIPAGEIPTVEQAMQRLELFRTLGPTPQAFSLRRRFEPDGRPVSAGRSGPGSSGGTHR